MHVHVDPTTQDRASESKCPLNDFFFFLGSTFPYKIAGDELVNQHSGGDDA